MSLRGTLAVFLLAGVLTLGACASRDVDGDDETVWEIVDGSEDYRLDRCPVSGNVLDAGRIAINYRGEEVQLHCENDLDTFLADPERFLARVRTARAR